MDGRIIEEGSVVKIVCVAAGLLDSWNGEKWVWLRTRAVNRNRERRGVVEGEQTWKSDIQYAMYMR